MDCYDYEIDNEIPSLGQIAEAGLGIQGGTVSHNPATHDGIALPGPAGHHPFLDLPRDQIVFAGRLYEKTSLQMVQLQHVHFVVVVPLEQQDHDVEEVDEEGPKWVIMNATVYQQSNLIPPYEIGDWVLRTTKWQQPAPQNPAYIARPRRTMPPRSLVTDDGNLQYLFDLPAADRQGIQIIEPSHKNPTRPGKTRGKTPRSSWAAAPRNYLFELVELAMRLLNRPLRFHDYEAITEALNREFRGKIVDGIPYAEKGVNPVNTYVVKGIEFRYEALVGRLFPPAKKGVEQ